MAPDKPSILEKRLASGPLQGGELQGRTLVVSRYAGIAVFHGLIMALTFDPCKPLKTRGGGRGSKLTRCAPKPTKRHYLIFGIPDLSADVPANCDTSGVTIAVRG